MFHSPVAHALPQPPPHPTDRPPPAQSTKLSTLPTAQASLEAALHPTIGSTQATGTTQTAQTAQTAQTRQAAPPAATVEPTPQPPPPGASGSNFGVARRSPTQVATPATPAQAPQQTAATSTASTASTPTLPRPGLGELRSMENTEPTLRSPIGKTPLQMAGNAASSLYKTGLKVATTPHRKVIEKASNAWKWANTPIQ